MKNILFLIITMITVIIFMPACHEDSDLVFDHEISDVPIEKKRICAIETHMQQLMQNPSFAKEYENRLNSFKKVQSTIRQKAQCNNPKIIPVAIHFQGINGADRSCLSTLSLRQIDILNEDFAGRNADISKWTNNAASYFPGVSFGETCVQFVIANTNHPNGYNLQNGDLAITINQTNGDQVGAWSGYLNIYVQINTGYLGYAPYGGSGNGDGVVIDASAFGAGQGCSGVSPDSPYNLGRTLTHEVGHYFLLDHIWGNGCNSDDDVSDTPDQASDYDGCPNLGASSCGSTDMHMNYMDYTNDMCMYMFSAGQSLRMENYITANLNNMVNKGVVVVNGTNDNGGGDNGGNEEPPTPVEVCSTPSNSNVIVINQTKVKVDWEDILDARRYRIRYRAAGTSSWNTSNVSSSEKTISNLTPGKKYEYQLRTDCPTGWTPFSSSSTFTTTVDQGGGDDSPAEGTYTLKITLDDYGSETTWYILDQNFKDVEKGGPYQDGQSGKVISQSLNLARGCYELEVDDLYGDGMCCDYGNGFVELLNANNQRVAFLNGRFGYYDYVAFCIDGNGFRITKENRDPKKLGRNAKKK